MKHPRLVEVTWTDSAFSAGWKATGAPRPDIAHCRTVGYLIEKSAHRVLVAMSVSDEGDYSETMAIPRSVVTGVRKVKV